MKNDILFIGGTHGNEPIGVEVLQELEKERLDFDWIIGNEPAFKHQERGFEGDLNRSAPGDPKSSIYEQRRAAEILEEARAYRFVIDLHGAPADCGIFLLITNLTQENLRLASLFSIPRIVYWPSISAELKGPLSEYFPCGLEIECGPKNDPAVQKSLELILIDFLDDRKKREKRDWQKELRTRELYQVTDVLPQTDSLPPLKEFEIIRIREETFYPLLTNTYQRFGIACYKLQKKTLDDFLTC